MAVERLDFTGGKITGHRPGVHPIPLANNTVAAFIGRTERGPLNEPVAIESFEEFRAVFGAHTNFSFISHAVQHYFIHGGQRAVVVRVANRATRAGIDVPAASQSLRLQARHPGAHEYLRVSVDYDRVENDPQRFNLVVQRLRGPGAASILDQELFPAISMRHADRRFVVDALRESRLVHLSGPLPAFRPDPTRPLYPGQPIPYIETTTPGSDGEPLTDYDVIGSNMDGTGLFALDRSAGVDLLCIPPPPHADFGTTAFVAAERYAERHRAILIWDPPWTWTSAHAAVIGIRNAGYSSANAMIYFPRIRPRGENGRFPRGIPACGAVAGILARNDAAGVWNPSTPASAALKSPLTAVAGLGEQDALVLKRFGINAFRQSFGASVSLDGNSTLASAGGLSSFWSRLNRRRLLFFVLNSIERGTAWVLDALDAADLDELVDRQVRTFFNGLFEQGALAGRNARQAFFVEIPKRAAPDVEPILRFGFALERAGEFLIYEARYCTGAVKLRQVASLEFGAELGNS